MLIKIVTLLLTITSGVAGAAPFQRGFVQIRPQQSLWVEQRPAQNGKPTIVFLNGLTWTTAQWGPLVAALNRIDRDLGIVLYDMQGMGHTLLSQAPCTQDIDIQNQVRDLHDLKQTLNLSGPVFLAGLSYGGGVGLQYMADYPGEFKRFVAMSPYLSRIPEQDQWIKGMISFIRITNPFDPRSDEQIYDAFLHSLIYTSYSAAEPILLTNPFKLEATYHLVRGMLTWDVSSVIAKLPQASLDLMTGTLDPYVKLPQQNQFWQSLPRGVGASHVVMHLTGHKIPEEQPTFTATWLMKIVLVRRQLMAG